MLAFKVRQLCTNAYERGFNNAYENDKLLIGNCPNTYGGKSFTYHTC